MKIQSTIDLLVHFVNKLMKHTFSGLRLRGLQPTLFSLSADGETESGLAKRRDAMPRSRRAFGLDFTVPSGVFLSLNAFWKSLQRDKGKYISTVEFTKICARTGLT